MEGSDKIVKNIIVSPWNETDAKNDITATSLSELMPRQILIVKPQATTSMYGTIAMQRRIVSSGVRAE